ncbi:SDR family oxidoreductase [Streptomyces glomeratus]|uniref:SDR family oxidoreductase n=1 Tax=Streptomyces glomeratus TaxID=284452 RepID=A0ABP6LKN2_9ACTN|nr:SDR family oxidoreductase [Streptomyces glomeratus]
MVAGIRDRGGKADFVAADLGEPESVRQLAGEAVGLGGGSVDILVNNAGIFPFSQTEQTTQGDMDAVYGLNVMAPYQLVAALAPAMAERGRGAIVNVRTVAAARGFAGLGLYGSSKAALDLLTKAWAAEFGPRGVRINGWRPARRVRRAPPAWATTSTPSPRMRQPGGRPNPGRTPGEPREIAYLASDAASYVQGAVLAVDGGLTAV